MHIRAHKIRNMSYWALCISSTLESLTILNLKLILNKKRQKIISAKIYLVCIYLNFQLSKVK